MKNKSMIQKTKDRNRKLSVSSNASDKRMMRAHGNNYFYVRPLNDKETVKK